MKAEETGKERRKGGGGRGGKGHRGKLGPHKEGLVFVEFVTQTSLGHFLVSVPFSFHVVDQSHMV